MSIRSPTKSYQSVAESSETESSGWFQKKGQGKEEDKTLLFAFQQSPTTNKVYWTSVSKMMQEKVGHWESEEKTKLV
ncbi:unnamed protein product [Rhizopus stolonifer]